MSKQSLILQDERRMAQFMQYGFVAAKEALADANWHPEDPAELEMTVRIAT